jgi:hypothetical protein
MRQKWTQIKLVGYDLGLASVSGRRAANTKSARKQYNLKIKICVKTRYGKLKATNGMREALNCAIKPCVGILLLLRLLYTHLKIIN